MMRRHLLPALFLLALAATKRIEGCCEQPPAPAPAPTPAPTPAPASYVIQTSGTCATSVQTQAECEAAAASLSLTDVSADESVTGSAVPPYCSYMTSSDTLLYHDGTGSCPQSQCQGACSSISACICKQ